MRAVILVHSLVEFLAEAPPPRPVRLSYHVDQITRLDLQALTPAGLVWLHDAYSQATPPKVRAQVEEAAGIVAAWLNWQGYEVRGGRWATAVKPERGRFECFAWQKAGQGYELITI